MKWLHVKHMHLRLLTTTSVIAGIGLAVSAISQPAVPTKEMVVTPFEQVKFVAEVTAKPLGPGPESHTSVSGGWANR